MRADLKRVQRDSSSGRIRVSDVKPASSGSRSGSGFAAAARRNWFGLVGCRAYAGSVSYASQRSSGSRKWQRNIRAAPAQAKSNKGLLVGVAIGLLLLTAAGVGAYKFVSRKAPLTLHDMEITNSRRAGKAIGVAVSPDGQYVVYVCAMANSKPDGPTGSHG